MYYVNERWLGGMLTNFKTIHRLVNILFRTLISLHNSVSHLGNDQLHGSDSIIITTGKGREESRQNCSRRSLPRIDQG